MKHRAKLTLVGLLVLGGCGATFRTADFSPIEYLVLRAYKSDHISVAALKDAAVRQATAGCQQAHQAIKVFEVLEGEPPRGSLDFSDRALAIQALEAQDARNVTIVHVHFRCISARELKS